MYDKKNFQHLTVESHTVKSPLRYLWCACAQNVRSNQQDIGVKAVSEERRSEHGDTEAVGK